MRRFFNSSLAACAFIIPLALLCLHTSMALRRGQESVFPPWQYFLNDMILVYFVFAFMFLAFLARRNGQNRRKSILMAAGGVLMTFVLLDLFVVFISCFSIGPEGLSCISHVNWYNRFVHSNSKGYWEDDLAPYEANRKENVLIIAALGDSFTWGQGLCGRQFRFTDRLTAQLAPSVRVLNFGRGGTGTRDQIRLAADMESVHPDVVLLCYLANDIHDGVNVFTPARARCSSFQRGLIQVSPLYNYLYYKALFPLQWKDLGAWSFCSLIANYRDKETMDAHGKDIAALVDRVRRMNACPIAVILPFPHLWTHIQPPARQAIYASIVSAYKDTGTHVIELQDLEETYPPGRFDINSMDGHPNAEVHKAMAERIYRWLQEHPDAWKEKSGSGKPAREGN